MAGMDVATIRAWIAKAEQDLSELSDQAEEVQRRIAHGRVQLNLMYELLASLTNEPIAKNPRVFGQEGSIRERVSEATEKILRDQGKPMRIQDIHAEFVRRQLPLPGSGAPANIAAHLVDRGVFTRPARGVFGLAEWANSNVAEATKTTKARREALQR